MKQLTFLSFFALILFLACSKKDDHSHDQAGEWIYSETQCSDPWSRCQILSDPQARDLCIEGFIRDSLGVQFTDFHIHTEEPAATCQACNCTSGRVIHLNADEQYEQKLLSIGFKKQ